MELKEALKLLKAGAKINRPEEDVLVDGTVKAAVYYEKLDGEDPAVKIMMCVWTESSGAFYKVVTYVTSVLSESTNWKVWKAGEQVG